MHGNMLGRIHLKATQCWEMFHLPSLTARST